MASIQIEARRLKAACENFLIHYSEVLQNKLDVHINRLVGKREYWLFGSKYTYETAKEELENADIWHPYQMTKKLYGSQDVSQAKQLLTLSKLGDPVTLTTDDVWITEYENA